VSNTKLFVMAGLLIAAGLALFVSPLASSEPDGLERVATDEGFIDAAGDHALKDNPVADYSVKGIDDDRWSTAISGLIGVLVTFGVGVGVFALLRTFRSPAREMEAGDR
jgi:hypothetical protein